MATNNNHIITSSEFIKLIFKKHTLINLTITDELIFSSNLLPKHKSLNFVNCKFEKEFEIFRLDSNFKLYFSNCVFSQRLLIHQVNIINISFLKCTFNHYFDLKQLVTKFLKFEHCTLNLAKSLMLHQFETDNLTFIKNESSHDIYIRPKKVLNVLFSGGESKYTLTFATNNESNIIKKFTLLSYNNYRTNYIIRNIKVKFIHIKGVLSESSLYLSDIILKSGVIHYFYNYGNTTFNSLKPFDSDSLVVIKNSHLGSAILSSIDFTLFRRVLLSNSTIINIVPVNLVWCLPKVLEENPLETLKEDYRQLKIVTSKNDDIPAKLKFQRLEMHSYLKQLQSEKGKKVDKFILWTNYLSNDFGLNWSIALSWLIILSVIWYTLIKYYLGQTYFDASLIGDEIGRFIRFINPAHRFNDLFNLNGYKGTALLFDGISRITSAYLLYQFVIAFRKYSKK